MLVDKCINCGWKYSLGDADYKPELQAWPFLIRQESCDKDK